MKFCLVISVAVLMPEYCSTETTKEPSDEDKPSPNMKEALPSSPPESWDGNNVNFLWTYRPTSRVSNADDLFGTRRMVFRQPYALTRVAKTLSYGFDPQFRKDYFEPFERRQKPVTLIGIRRNGIFPRVQVNVATKSSSSEVAELQSPFNDISNFWLDEPGSS